MNGIQLSRLAGAGSAALLLAALGFQIIGYAPCELCVLQRWPHVVAVIIALAVVLTGRVRILAILGALAVATSMAIAIYHSGVEIGWWEGPATCSVRHDQRDRDVAAATAGKAAIRPGGALRRGCLALSGAVHGDLECDLLGAAGGDLASGGAPRPITARYGAKRA